MNKVLAAIVCVVGVLVLWAVCLRMLLDDARHNDPGAYLVVGFVFMLLPGAAVAFIALLLHDRPARPVLAPIPLLPREIERSAQSAQLYRFPQQALPTPDVQQVALGAEWSQPRLVARETTTVRELFDSGQTAPAELRRFEGGALWPAIERHG